MQSTYLSVVLRYCNLFFCFLFIIDHTFSRKISNLRIKRKEDHNIQLTKIKKLKIRKQLNEYIYIFYNINNKIQMKGRLFHEYYNTSPNDVALSCWQYQDFIDSVNDARLSPNALMRFKNLYRQHSMQLLIVPIITFPFAFLINKWIVGFACRGMASSRFNFLGMCLIYPLTMYWGYTRPIPRKYYTELLADDGDDGQYIRDCVSHHKPELWRRISWQLEQLGLDFRQNLRSNTSIEFPSNFVTARSLIL